MRLLYNLLVITLVSICSASAGGARHSTVIATPAIVPSGVVDVIVSIGESNGDGQQYNPEALSYTLDQGIQTYYNGNWYPYAPNANPGYLPAVGLTGYKYFNGLNTHWAYELQYLVNERAAHPTRPVFLFKYGVSGSYIGFFTGMDPELSWDDPDGGNVWGNASSRLTTALAALVSIGYTPNVKTVIIMGGGNDQSRVDTYTTYATTLASLISRIQAQAWYTGSTVIILNRISTAVTGTGPTTVRSATVAAANGTTIRWVDTDSIERNPTPSNNPHYDTAGQLALGQADWNTYH